MSNTVPGRGWTLSTELKRRCMVLEGTWLRAMIPDGGARSGPWHDRPPLIRLGPERATLASFFVVVCYIKKKGFASLWERCGFAAHGWMRHLARALANNPAATCYRWKSPLRWRTCQPIGGAGNRDTPDRIGCAVGIV